MTQIGHSPRNYAPENIEGKRVLVSGGATGIGRATVRLLLERGAHVFTFGRDEAQLQDALTEFKTYGEAHIFAADQSKPEDVRRAFQEADAKLGGLDIVVANAGVPASSAARLELDEIYNAVQINVAGTFMVAHEAIARFRGNPINAQKAGRGHLVLIGSIDAENPDRDSDIHSGCEAAVRHFAISLRKTVNKDGIKVSLIEPGRTLAEMLSPDDAQEQIARGELLQAEDVAEAIHYVLTQPARCDVVSVQLRPHLQEI